ncbi:MAG TPA: hypothetical protein VFS97_14700 [Nitrososphaeraceae archaeon]|nr:hypothetical protein [Nitrososphaeraceae archaeon]
MSESVLISNQAERFTIKHTLEENKVAMEKITYTVNKINSTETLIANIIKQFYDVK